MVNDLEVEANADGDDGVGFKGEIIAGVLFNKLRFESLLIVGVVAFYCYVLRTSHDCWCAKV